MRFYLSAPYSENSQSRDARDNSLDSKRCNTIQPLRAQCGGYAARLVRSTLRAQCGGYRRSEVVEVRSTHEPTRGGGQQYSGGQKCGIWASSLHHLGISGAQLWGCVREAPL